MTAPLAVPRTRFRCLEARTRRLLEQLGLTAGDLSRPERELHARLAQASSPSTAGDPSLLRARLAEEIAPAVDALTRTVSQARPELGRAAQRTRDSVTHVLGRLVDRYTRALAERDAVTRDRLQRVRAALLPGGVPQERVYAWPSLAARIGPTAFTRLVLSALAADAFAPEPRDLYP
jgi:bacillithiol synthase